MPQSREEKRAAAVVRQQASDLLSPSQRLTRLDEKFGPDKGAVKERLKLHHRLSFGRTEAPVDVVLDAIVLHGTDTIEEPAEGRRHKPRRRQRNEKRGG